MPDTSKMFSKTTAPEYRITGRFSTEYITTITKENINLVPRPNRASISCGIVVVPILRYVGKNQKASANKVNSAPTSQPIGLISDAHPCPFVPTSCSADRLVNSNEPAITTPGSPRPARKYPSAESKLSPRVFHPEIAATSAVKNKKDIAIHSIELKKSTFFSPFFFQKSSS